MNSLNKTLNLVNGFLNSSDYNDDNFADLMHKFYRNFNEIENKSCALYFVENSDYTLKTAINKKGIVKNIDLNPKFADKLFKSNDNFVVFETKKDGFLFNNTVLIKLSIRTSVFGFILFSSDIKFNNDILLELNTLASVISYKIKDYELNEVFKIQLKAMQDAIIEKEEANSIIKKQRNKLIELDKTKNLFLANISHDLRTPLNAIIGFSQALDSKIFGELNEKQEEYIKDIHISSLHLLGMINEILDISKLEAHAMKYTPSEINVHHLIQEVINILEPLYKNKNIKVSFISKYNGLIIADYQKFQQILFNLLSNAIKFTEDKGKITITSYKKDGNYCLDVSDTGIGIDKKYHNKIFKKFVHLNNVYKSNQNSTGLGLTITKQLVKLHHGKIFLESELNKGTTFKMEFKNILV